MMERHCAQLSAVSNSRSARVEGVPVAAIPSPPTAAAVEYLPVLSATDCDDPTAYACTAHKGATTAKPKYAPHHYESAEPTHAGI
jgi:hypothetical protein